MKIDIAALQMRVAVIEEHGPLRAAEPENLIMSTCHVRRVRGGDASGHGETFRRWRFLGRHASVKKV